MTNSPSAALKSKSLFCKRVISRVMRTIRFLHPMISLLCRNRTRDSTSNGQRHHAQAAADRRDLLSSISTYSTIANCDEHIDGHQTETLRAVRTFSFKLNKGGHREQGTSRLKHCRFHRLRHHKCGKRQSPFCDAWRVE
jgi:hypothetical protein